MNIAATGHRPPRLNLDYSPKSNEILTLFAKSILEDMVAEYKEIAVISGMAQGWDQACAHAAIMLGQDVICALPFAGQEQRWPSLAQKRYNAILKRAKRVEVVCKTPYKPEHYITRDRWMVDNADGVLALWDGERKGGTFETIEYAKKSEVDVINTWNHWEQHFFSLGGK